MLRKWSVRFLSVAGTQAVCQLLNGVVAFMLVRMLPKDHYAWFTLTASMAAILNAISDSGVGIAMMSLGGTVWQDRPKLSALIRASLDILVCLAAAGSVVVLPLLIWLLARQGASWDVICVLCALNIIPQWVATRSIIFSIVNRLHSRVWQMQQVELTAAGMRFVLTTLPWLCGMTHVVWAASAIAASLLAQGVLVRRQVAPLIDNAPPEDFVREFTPKVQATVRYILPSTVFNCVQAYLAVWILGFLGGTAEVADIGALNRISFVANLAGAPLAMLIAPAFARCQDFSRLRKVFAGVFAVYLLFFAGFAAVCWLEGPLILRLFGPKYSHLSLELFLVAVGVGLTALNGVCCTLNLAKGWVRSLWVSIPVSLVAQVVTILSFDMRSVSGAAWLSISLGGAYLLYSGTVSIYHLARRPADHSAISI